MPIIEETNEGKFYAFKDKIVAKRIARIYLNRSMQPNSKWKFFRIEKELPQGGGSIEDLLFMKEIAEEVERRLKELNPE